MNKKIGEILYSLLETKKFIVERSLNDKSGVLYDNTIKNLDNVIVEYTLNNKMSKKEILDTTFSLYNTQIKKSIREKIKDVFDISKRAQTIKEKIVENHKKKKLNSNTRTKL